MRRIGFAGSVLLVASMLGCGDDDSGAPPDGGGSGGSFGSGGSGSSDTGSGSGGSNGSTGQSGNGAGTGGANAGSGGNNGGNGSGGNGGNNGAGGFMMMMPVMCGSTTCMAPMGATAPSCCLPDMTCGGGYMGECQEWGQPGTLDSTCPSHMTPNGGTLQGCCKPNNQCGVMSQVGFGCVERTHLAMFAGGPLTAMTCGSADDGGADGG